MQLGLNKQLQPYEIKSYKHKIKNQTSTICSNITFNMLVIISINFWFCFYKFEH